MIYQLTFKNSKKQDIQLFIQTTYFKENFFKVITIINYLLFINY